MSNFGKKIEMLANCCIIIVAVLLSIFLIKNFRASSDHEVKSNNQVAQRRDPTGKKLSLPDVDWSQSESTVIIALQSRCHFCTESAPFYKQLVSKQSAQSNQQLIVVSPEPSDTTKAYLVSLGVSIDKVRQADLQVIGVGGTPTILRVDSGGVVTNAWMGRLGDDRAAEVLASFQ
jgi:hypothetical protein